MNCEARRPQTSSLPASSLRGGPRAQWILGALLLVLCSGCNSLAPRYERPEFEAWTAGGFGAAPAVAPESEVGPAQVDEAGVSGHANGDMASVGAPDLAQSNNSGATEESASLSASAPQTAPKFERWWAELGDGGLEILVEEALANNPGLLAAIERVEEAQALAAQAAGGRWPTIGLTANATRSRVELDTGNQYASIFSPGGNISWRTDLFGRLRSAARAAGARFGASEQDRRALMHSLAAEVVRTRADLAALSKRLELARGIRASRAQTETTVERRYASGVTGVGAVDVHLARENLSSAEANLPALEREYALRALALDRLLGRKPGSSQELDLGSWSARPPAQVPNPGLPAALLDRRPDLLASELRAIAANHGIGVALADLYPDLTLSGQASRGVNAAGGAFQIDGLVASATAGLSYTLFSGGALRAAARAEQARARAALHDYAGLVLTAFNEVEGALVRERYLAEQLERVNAQQAAARAAESAARGRYEAGLESLLVLLETERRRALAEDLLAQLEAAAWSARIDLILALGGAWWPDGAAAGPAPAPADVYGAEPRSADRPDQSTQTPAHP